MKTIYKYPLEINDEAQEFVFEGRVLHVAMQHGTLCMWAEVYTDILTSPITHKFRVYGTGHNIEDSAATYIGTAHDPRGFVWHVYEVW